MRQIGSVSLVRSSLLERNPTSISTEGISGAFKTEKPDDWIGRYMRDGEPMLPSRLRVEFGSISFDDAIEERLDPVLHVPPRGALCATKRAERWYIGYALGISVGTKAAFISRQGVLYLPLDDVIKAWVPR